MNNKCGLGAIIVVLGCLHLATAHAVEITEGEHRTKAATEKLPALVCYRCDSMIDGMDRCKDLKDNSSAFHANCSDDARICQVKKISMMMIAKTGDIGIPQVWLVQRNCTGSCDPGCIIIGERTKLYSCTTCCEESFCNSGSGADSFLSKRQLKLDLVIFYFLGLIFSIQT